MERTQTRGQAGRGAQPAGEAHGRGALSGITGVRLRRLHGLFSRHWSQYFRRADIDLSAVQGGLLLLIRANPGLPQAAFARLLDVEPPSLAQTLAPLVQSGLVARRRDESDGRAMALHLTDAGREVARAIDHGQPRHEERLLAGLTVQERRTLLALLDKAVESAEGALAVASAERAVAAATDSKLEGKTNEQA